MYDVKNLSIWKNDGKTRDLSGRETVKLLQVPGRTVLIRMDGSFLEKDISELSLSVRAYNCLKRAHCHTVGDILAFTEEDGSGLMQIRNLGTKSANEILQRLEEYQEEVRKEQGIPCSNKKLVKPAKKTMDMEIEAFGLSEYAYGRLKKCGVRRVRDIYGLTPESDPGWPAVRELFDRLPHYQP